MKERFKIIRGSVDHPAYYDETEGEEVFTYRGFRFFAHRYERKEGPEWHVSCAMSGYAVGWSSSYDDAVEIAKTKITNRFETYISKLKKRPRALWHRPKPKAIETTESA